MSRLSRDVMQLAKTPPPDVVIDGNLLSDMDEIEVCMLGPESTPFAKGAWRVVLRLPQDYPVSPPKVFFVTKIFHPNVDPVTGEVCVDTLKRDWSASVDLCHILLTIRCLLIQPNPDSSLNEEAGVLIHDDYAKFESTARMMTHVHAMPRGQHNALQPTSASETNQDKPKPKKKTGLRRC